MTTIADIKTANSNASRTGYQITASTMTNERAVHLWLRELQVLEARIRRYAAEHGVDVAAGVLS